MSKLFTSIIYGPGPSDVEYTTTKIEDIDLISGIPVTVAPPPPDGYHYVVMDSNWGHIVLQLEPNNDSV